MLKVNPQLEEELKEFLRSLKIGIKSMTFIPLGEESFGWRVVTDNQTLFLKYCTQERILNNLQKVNKLLLTLGNLAFIAPPVLLDGKTEVPFKEGYIYAYPFVEGEVYTIRNEEFDKSLVGSLTKMMGEIHKIDVSNIEIPRESFEYNFGEQYIQIIQDIENGIEVPEISQDDFKKLNKVIADFEETSKDYRENPPNMVLTHGDITGRNILRTESGYIKLIDWDEVKIAPKERDINFLYDNLNFDFKYYQSITKSEDFNPDLRKYYNDLWALESILVNIQRLQYFKEEYGSREYLLEDVIECLGYY